MAIKMYCTVYTEFYIWLQLHYITAEKNCKIGHSDKNFTILKIIHYSFIKSDKMTLFQHIVRWGA